MSQPVRKYPPRTRVKNRIYCSSFYVKTIVIGVLPLIVYKSLIQNTNEAFASDRTCNENFVDNLSVKA